jgi:hypothetical protein
MRDPFCFAERRKEMKECVAVALLGSGQETQSYLLLPDLILELMRNMVTAA